MTQRDFDAMAAAMDLRVRQLAAKGIVGQALINPMVGYMPDLQRLWDGTTDEHLASLCVAYPGFHECAFLMEEASANERANPDPAYHDLPRLDDSLKPLLEAEIAGSAVLERGYQSVIDADCPGAMRTQFGELERQHRRWLELRAHALAALSNAELPMAVMEVIGPPIDQMSVGIASPESQARTATGAL